MSKTPAQKWKDAIIRYRKTCQTILGVSKSVRYAGVINEYGRTLTGMMRPGLKPLLNPEDAKNEFFIMSNLITLRNSQSRAFGGLNHAVLKHKKSTIICIPADDVIYYISLSSGVTSVEELIRKIRKLIQTGAKP